MPKYTVHLYPIFRVTVPYIEAEDQVAAIRKAEEMVDLHAVLDWKDRGESTYRGVQYFNYADDLDGFLVDEEGDPGHQSSTRYDKDYSPI